MKRNFKVSPQHSVTCGTNVQEYVIEAYYPEVIEYDVAKSKIDAINIANNLINHDIDCEKVVIKDANDNVIHDTSDAKSIESATEVDKQPGWVTFAEDDEGNKWVAGVYESERSAHYWAAMDSVSDREYNYGHFKYSVEFIDDVTSDMWDNYNEFNKLKLNNHDTAKETIESSTSTRDRISYLEDRIAVIEDELADQENMDGERSVDLQMELNELKEQLNFAWQDDEEEYNYALERQEFNPDGSLKYYDDIEGVEDISASEEDDEPHKLVLVYDDGLNDEELPETYTSFEVAEEAAKEMIETCPDNVCYIEIIDPEYRTHPMATVYREGNEPTEEELWSIFEGKKYAVCASKSTDYGEIDHMNRTVRTNDPMLAIEAWFKLSVNYPTETAIMTETKENSTELCKVATPEVITKFYNKYQGNPYQLEHLIEGAQKQVENNSQGFYEMKDFGDQIYPFCYG